MTETRLHPDDRRLLQEVTALLRGLLAALPRPVPPGDWGRSGTMFAESHKAGASRVQEPRSGPISIVSKVPPPPRQRRNSRHTPESIAADAATVDRWLRQTGVSRLRLAAEAGMNATLLSLVSHKREGLSDNARAKFTAAVERLRARRKDGTA